MHRSVSMLCSCLLLLVATAWLMPHVLPRAWAQPADQTSLAPPAAAEGDLAVYFSPGGGAMEAVVHLVRSARRTVVLHAFMLTAGNLRDALIEAHQRGVKVEVVLDRTNADFEFSKFDDLRKAGVTVYLPREENLKMHNKVVLIDNDIVITGSMNFTVAGNERNVENMVIIRKRPQISRAYQQMHDKLKQMSQRYPRS